MFTLTPKIFLIVCPLVFLAGFVDAIGGGGGLIALPAYIIAGLPAHYAIATNKLSSCCGTTVATIRFIKNKMVNFKLAIPSILFAAIGSAIGSNLSLYLEEALINKMLLFILPVTAFVVLNKHIFHDNPDAELVLNARTYIVVMLSALVVGIYDGLFGPGSGTFWIISFTIFGKMSIAKANGQTKVINLTTNITSLVVFFLNAQVLLPLGIAAGICNMIGNWLGSGLVMTKGSKIVKPIIILVLFLLLLKILGVY